DRLSRLPAQARGAVPAREGSIGDCSWDSDCPGRRCGTAGTREPGSRPLQSRRLRDGPLTRGDSHIRPALPCCIRAPTGDNERERGRSLENIMTAEELRQRLYQKPFTPFRVRLKDGRYFDIRYPYMNLIAEGIFIIGIPAPHEPDACCYDRQEWIQF